MVVVLLDLGDDFGVDNGLGFGEGGERGKFEEVGDEGSEQFGEELVVVGLLFAGGKSAVN